MRGALKFGAPFLLVFLGFYYFRQPHVSAVASTPVRFDKWRVLGPGGGGAQFNVAVSPLKPGLVFVASDMSGAYISHDYGSSWRMFNLLSAVRQFAFHPKSASTIYAASTGLWRSVDTGRTWELIFPTSPKGVRFTGEDTGLPVIDGDPSVGIHPIRSVAIDPDAPSNLFLWVANSLYRSNDDGKHWANLATVPSTDRLRYPDSANRLFIDPSSPVSDRRLIITSSAWVANWQRAKLSVNGYGNASSGKVESTCVAKGPIVYASSHLRIQSGVETGGLSQSTDGGATWKRIQPLDLDPASGDIEFPAIGCSYNHPDTVLASFRNLKQPDGKIHFGVVRSTDAGRTWKRVWDESDRPSPRIHDSWITSAFGPDWGEAPLSLAVHPDDPSLIYACDLGRTLRSTDAGSTWDALYSHTVEGGRFATAGLDMTTTYGVHFDPFRAGHLLLSQSDIGPFRSTDNGESWLPAHSGIPSNWRNTTYWAEFDPAVRGRVWAAMSRLHDFPRTKMFRSPPQRWVGGISRSDDSGGSWTPSNTGMGEAVVTHLVVDPQSPKSSRTLYAAAMQRGVFRSTDGGSTWQEKNAGLPSSPRAWRIAQASDGTLYLVLTRKSEAESFGNDTDGSLYHSNDRGEHWSRVFLPRGVNGPTGIAVDPKDNNRLYLSAWGRYRDEAGELAKDGGVYLSTDAGKSWKSVLPTDQFISDVTLDNRSGVAYAAGFQASIWRSEDRGYVWTRIRGFNFKAAQRVIPDPQNPDRIFVTTYGGGLWYGPARGDKDATEDITAPANVRYSR